MTLVHNFKKPYIMPFFLLVLDSRDVSDPSLEDGRDRGDLLDLLARRQQRQQQQQKLQQLHLVVTAETGFER